VQEGGERIDKSLLWVETQLCGGASPKSPSDEETQREKKKSPCYPAQKNLSGGRATGENLCEGRKQFRARGGGLCSGGGGFETNHNLRGTDTKNGDRATKQASRENRRGEMKWQRMREPHGRQRQLWQEWQKAVNKEESHRQKSPVEQFETLINGRALPPQRLEGSVPQRGKRATRSNQSHERKLIKTGHW